MALFDVFRGQFIDIIDWTEPARNDILAYRFPRFNNEIKMGAKLIVREGQTALFVNEGTLSDIFLNATFDWSVAPSGTSGRFDVQSILTHELGHFHGLGHSALGEPKLLVKRCPTVRVPGYRPAKPLFQSSLEEA